MSKSKPAPADEKNQDLTAYEPDPREQAVLERHRSKAQNTPAPPDFKVVDGHLELKHPDQKVAWELFQASVGTQSWSFVGTILAQLLGLFPTKNDHVGVSAAVATIAGQQPSDELETMLLSQIVSIHNATMSTASTMSRANNDRQRESAERSLNRLARTFVVQLEALKKYRGGEQRIVVQHQHVTVNDGGQAIVGTVEQRKGQEEG